MATPTSALLAPIIGYLGYSPLTSTIAQGASLVRNLTKYKAFDHTLTAAAAFSIYAAITNFAARSTPPFAQFAATTLPAELLVKGAYMLSIPSSKAFSWANGTTRLGGKTKLIFVIAVTLLALPANKLLFKIPAKYLSNFFGKVGASSSREALLATARKAIDNLHAENLSQLHKIRNTALDLLQ